MAASGTIDCIVKSVDYGGGIGHVTMKSFFTWDVDANGTLTVRYDHSESISGSAHLWGICGTVGGYGIHAYAQYSTDGGNTWTNVMSAPVVEVSICPSLTNVYNTMATCFSQFRPVHLNDSGLLRIVYGANRAPAPSASLPNSFPSYVQTEGQQVPVQIDVSWNAKLHFDANGGSGGPADITQKVQDDSIEFTVPSTQPTRKHFIFHGWSRTKKVCSGTTWYTAADAEVHAGDKILLTRDNPTVNLYAVWEYTYRPGQILVNGTWKSCDRDTNASTRLGRCDVRRNGQWVEMRTRRNKTGNEFAPTIRKSNQWTSQNLIGDEGACHDVTY